MRKVLLPVCTLLLAACQDTSSPTPTALQPISVTASARSAEPRPGYHIVVFRPGVSDVDGLSRTLVSAHRGELEHTYHNALKGFAGKISNASAAALRRHPDVLLVEPDGIMSAVVTQAPATWGIDRVDQRDLPLSNSYTYTATGNGVNVYIIDTGIRTTHSEFAGRAFSAFDAIGDGNGTTDCNGHGTHVSGTVAGTTYGIAKLARLYAVRVLGCGGSGATSGVIAGVDWVTANHVSPAVANMSLGGGISTALDQAVRNSVASGVTYAIAAGNSNVDACGGSPSRVLEAVVVGSTTTTDARSSFSNFGTCLDIFAPGSSITSSYNGSDTQTAILSGTSMAAPHVAGAAARYLEINPAATPAAVATALTSNATPGKVTSPGSGSPNLLLYTFFMDGGGPPPPPPPPNAAPVAAFTWSCAGPQNLTCTFDGRSSTDDVGVVNYAWDLGEWPNQFTSGAVVTRTYAHSATRTVVLTVTDGGGLTSTRTQAVTVGTPPPPPPPNQAPVAQFTFSCTNLTCNFNSSGSTDDVGITSRSWTFGDGSTAGNVVSPNRTYAAGGTYSVTLTVNDGGGLSNSTTQQVTVTAPPPPPNQPPVASFTFSCTNLSCSFNSTGSTDDVGITTRAWTFGDGGSAGNVVNPSYSYGAAGTYTVTLTVTDGGGLSNATTRQVTVSAPPPPPPPNQAPVARFTYSCNSTTCTFNASTSTDDTGIVSYNWDLGEWPNQYYTGMVVTRTYAHGSQRMVVLTVTDAAGLSSTVSQLVTIPN